MRFKCATNKQTNKKFPCFPIFIYKEKMTKLNIWIWLPVLQRSKKTNQWHVGGVWYRASHWLAQFIHQRALRWSDRNTRLIVRRSHIWILSKPQLSIKGVLTNQKWADWVLQWVQKSRCMLTRSCDRKWGKS